LLLENEKETDKLFRETGLYLKGLKASGMPPIFYDSREIHLQFGKWVDGFNDYIYWLTMKFLKSVYFGEQYDSESLRPIIADNLRLSKLYLDIRERFASADARIRGISEGGLRGHLASVAEAIKAVESHRPKSH
jgi:hypothetical protein